MTFENEGAELDTTSDAIEGSSSEASSGEGEGGEQQAAAPKQETKEPPFHEHPRFKEIVEQKNQALAAQKAMEQRLAQFEQRFNQSQQQAKAQPSQEQTELTSLIEDLKKVDPRLAAQIEAANKASSTVQQLQQKLEAFEKQQESQARQSQIQTAVSKINQMHESNKASPEVKQFINDKLDLLYMQGKLSMENLETEYKNAHEGLTKYLEAVKRSERESYVQDKKKDAAVPTSQPKGTPAKPSTNKPSWSKDPEVARQQIVSRFLKQRAANKDADSV